jgi:alpha-D-xyloside xylohydrolase
MYEGQRSVTDEKRVVNLTRSGYTGAQRYGTILWSGDTSATWDTLKKQIPAGLNACAAGIPYWTLDIGAFFVKKGPVWFWNGDFEAGTADFGYRELYTRWYQYGAFLPIFRSHGTDARREIWHYGDEGEMFYESLAAATRLRYRLLPYLYACAAQVTFEDRAMMRPLAFDFPEDKQTYNIGDQYLLGPSLMVCPVTTPMYYGPESRPLADREKARAVYLPAGTSWTDWHTGITHAGGQTLTPAAPIDRIPVLVRAGSILPLAEPAACTDEMRQDQFDLRICPGADGAFTLYLDAGDGYGYEQGQYATIGMTWDDRTGALTLHARNGSYPGMPERITFRISGMSGEVRTVPYTGEPVVIGPA